MSTGLKDTMVGYARDAEAPVDLGPVIRAGDRRRRVRGVVAGTVAAVTVAALAVGGTQLVGSLADGETPVAARDLASYAKGSTIHVGGEVIDVGDHEIHAYVRTANGFVFSDQDEDVFYVDGASVEQIGSGVVREGNLRADDDSAYVAWTDFGPDVPEFVVYDTSSMSEVVRTSAGNSTDDEELEDASRYTVVGIDDGAAVVVNGRGLARIDLATEESEQIYEGDEAVSEFDVMDFEGGLILHKKPGEDVWWDARKERILGPDYSADGTSVPPFTSAVSPDGTYAAGTTRSQSGKPRVVHLESGDVIRFTTPDGVSADRPVWLDSDTLLFDGTRRVADARDKWVRSVLTCEIASGACTTFADDVGGFGSYQVPDGQFDSDEGL